MLQIILAIIFLLAVIFIIVTVIDSNRFIVREYTLENEKIKEKIDLVLLADLHNKQYGKENKKLLEVLDKIHPDAVMSAGDILTAKPGKGYERAARFMERIASKYHVYYGLGNHEYRMKIYPEDYQDEFMQYTTRLKKAGVVVLDNESAVFSVKKGTENTNLRITGVSLTRSYYKRFSKIFMPADYLDRLAGESSQDLFQILLAHNPEYFKEYADWGADLVLSGHIHGGIMRLPVLGGVVSPKLVLFPKYDGGLFKKGTCSMVLSRGLGMHTIPIRLFNPGELVVIHLTPCEAGQRLVK